MTGNDVWTVKAAFDWTRDYLAKKGDESPRRSAEWLISAATGLSRIEVYAFHDRPLTLDERSRLREAVRRRGAGEPLQYVTGEVAFRHIVVKVRPGVLIPRPETEVLVDSALHAVDAAIADRGEALVADVCTGSGCIALSIAYERPEVRVFATDISAEAVDLARENAERLGLSDRVSVLAGDLFSALPAEYLGRLDVVVSNPPYIPTADLAALPGEVADFEPYLALDGGPDGLAVYRRILSEAGGWLRPGGFLAVELDVSRVKTAAREASKWYEGVEIVSDLTGRDRIVTAKVGQTTFTSQ